MKFLIREYMAKNRIMSLLELEKLTGLNKSTLHRRLNHPEELRLFEIRALDSVLHFSDEDLADLVRGVFDDVIPRSAAGKRTA
jgi:hypothetical protein